ncbi:MAG TPA: glycogen synthase [Chlamydiales bacterium]|nr:glycogen synthase [Chlamydiales bacterium]
MRIVHVAAEFAPIAKAGGLGEVVTGLGRELTAKGDDIEIIIPKYDFIDLSKLPNIKIEVPDFKCVGFANAMWSAKSEGCYLHLLEARHPAGYFHRGKIYGAEDDTARFIYFSRAVLEYLKLKKEPIDVLHLHDWHVSLCAPLVRDLFKELKVKAIVLSIHNVEYQGKCAVSDLNAIGLDGASYLTPDKLQDNHPKYPDTINLLKGGIVYADAIVPVSPTYAKEILTPEYGFNLDPTLKKMRSKITGILNGIDQHLWNPSTDRHLALPYTLESATKGKAASKDTFNLPKGKRPWLGTVTRLVSQKGPELLEEALHKTIHLDGCFLLLGSSPHPNIQAHFDQLKEKYKNDDRVFLQFDYDDALAHRIYAALDYLIVPSHYEPCGLTQLIAMRYGTIPIVRSTGGLKDTVFDCEDSKIPIAKRNGFTFPLITPTSMNATLERAFRLFRSEPSTLQGLIRCGMQSDFSWKKPAQEYHKLYIKLYTSITRPRGEFSPLSSAWD